MTDTTDTTHACPGGCGRRVPHRLYACRDCWSLLPRDLQRSITGNRMGTPGHAEAMHDAYHWYRDPTAGDTP